MASCIISPQTQCLRHAPTPACFRTSCPAGLGPHSVACGSLDQTYSLARGWCNGVVIAQHAELCAPVGLLGYFAVSLIL